MHGIQHGTKRFPTFCHHHPSNPVCWHHHCPYFRDKESETYEATQHAQGHPVEFRFQPTSARLLTPGTPGAGCRHGNLAMATCPRNCDPRTSQHVANWSVSPPPWCNLVTPKGNVSVGLTHVSSSMAAARANHGQWHS